MSAGIGPSASDTTGRTPDSQGKRMPRFVPMGKPAKVTRKQDQVNAMVHIRQFARHKDKTRVCISFLLALPTKPAEESMHFSRAFHRCLCDSQSLAKRGLQCLCFFQANTDANKARVYAVPRCPR